MCYYFWGICAQPVPAYRHVNGVPVPLPSAPDPHEFLGDWAWAEWVQEQGIGE